MSWLANNLVAILALVVSVVGCILNWIHTSRAFNAISYPFLRIIMGRWHLRMAISPKPAPYVYCFGTCVGATVVNQSDDVSVSFMKVTLDIGVPTKSGRLWGTYKWHRLIQDTWDYGLKPRDTRRFSYHDRVEEFLVDNAPHVCRKEGDIDKEYVLLRMEPLRVRASILYRPARIGARLLAGTQYYLMTALHRRFPAETVGMERLRVIEEEWPIQNHFWDITEVHLPDRKPYLWLRGWSARASA